MMPNGGEHPTPIPPTNYEVDDYPNPPSDMAEVLDMDEEIATSVIVTFMSGETINVKGQIDLSQRVVRLVDSDGDTKGFIPFEHVKIVKYSKV